MDELFTLELQAAHGKTTPDTYGGVPIGIYTTVDDAIAGMEEHCRDEGLRIITRHTEESDVRKGNLRVTAWFYCHRVYSTFTYGQFFFVTKFTKNSDKEWFVWE